MAGRLGQDENGRAEIQCNGEGVLFMVAETTSAIDDFGDFMPSSNLRQLVPTIDHSNDVASFPLLLVQVTHLRCGGVCLGVLMHHTAVDGSSAMHFLNSWAEMTRGVPISILPFFDRTIIRNGVPSSPTFRHNEYQPLPTLNTPTQTIEFQSSPKPISVATFKVSADQVSVLKAKSKKGHGNAVRFSTYEILAAHIWRCMCKARRLSDDQESWLYTTINGRSRLNPPLPPGYFGNPLFHAMSLGKSGDIQSEPFACTVERIHKAIERMDDAYLKSALAYLDQLPDLTALVRGAKTYISPNLSVTSWQRLGLHDADFGWDQPIHMGPGGVFYQGKAYILSSPSKDGCFSLPVCLASDEMQIFKECFYEF